VNFLAGRDEIIGDYLVQHPGIHVIGFTGSREVGLRLNQLAAKLRHGQHHVKRVIAEMGGQNAIIIDADADLDDAVPGTLGSAFGYAGQKCSAASRVVVMEATYDAFLQRLLEATQSLRVGLPEDPATFVGPLIDADAQDKVLAAIETARRTATCRLQVDVSDAGPGYFVGPTLFTDAHPYDPLAQEEIFGPVLLVMRARDFTEALGLANATPYALTGGLYSRRPSHIERAKCELEVGNLYINRKITGALVGRQAFGGFKLSGIGSKAGGPDYLLQFMQPRTVTENTLRRGFAPDATQ
jgi:RHH-type proline utilization regulon transcriptional repressor/proline dehydrogenase/delta 1-pyrroline-5-carboxylate dehydrogenase